MTATLSQNFYDYMRLQHDINYALHTDKQSLIGDLSKKLQLPAQELTSYEKEYADWALSLYSRVSIKLIKESIKGMAVLDRDYKKTLKALSRKEVTYTDVFAISKKARNYPANTTQMCSIRAAMRGKLHKRTMSFEEQRILVEEVIKHFNKVKE